MKKNKGITLIALIITIIVMLILVAVSVNVLIKSNLIGTAEKVVDKYKTASEEEANGGTIEINGKKYASIEDYIEGKEAITEVHNWERTGDNLTCKHCNRTVTIGQELDYKDNGKGTSSIGEAESGIATAKTNGEGWASSYGKQTISKDDNTKWVVLGAEDVNKNGTKETLLLTTATPTTGTIRLYGVASYNNCIKEINRMCKEIYGEEAEGMTIEDVNNCLSYTAPDGMCGKHDSTTNKWTYYTLPKETKISELGSSYGDIWEDIQNNAYQDENETKKYFTPSYPEGSTNSSVLGDIEIDGYGYVADSTVGAPEGVPVLPDSTTTATKNVIFGSDKSNRYWLASRGVFARSDFARFGPGPVGEGYAYSCYGLFGSDGGSGDGEFPLRAVVSLRSDIPAVVTDSGSEPS